jgi:hypothetical protein
MSRRQSDLADLAISVLLWASMFLAAAAYSQLSPTQGKEHASAE